MERDGKRKMAAPEEEVRQDHTIGDEEEKIEEFFAIVKRLREARILIANCSRELEVRDKDAKKVKARGSVWTPVFKLEDFAGQEKDGNSNTSNGRSLEEEISKGKEKEREEKGLDLNLSL